MTFVLQICVICTFLIGVLLAAGYLYDRLPHSQNPAPATALPTQQLTNNYSDYVAYVQVMIDCVNENFKSCDLARPGCLAQHMPLCNPDGSPSGIAFDPKFGFVYKVEFERSAYDSGGMRQKATYSTMDCKVMANILNQHLSNFCVFNGCPPCSIVDVEDKNGGKVCFTLGGVQR
jgi:hypothetical protein